MKNLGIILLAFFPFGIFGQNAIKVTVSGMIFNANVDSVRISQNFGNVYKDYGSAAMDKKGNFKLSLELPNPDYYYLRVGTENIHLILSPAYKGQNDRQNSVPYPHFHVSTSTFAGFC